MNLFLPVGLRYFIRRRRWSRAHSEERIAAAR